MAAVRNPRGPVEAPSQRRPSGFVIGLAGAGATVVVAGVVLAIVLTGGSSSSKGSQAAALSVAISQHQLATPECAPVHGVRWFYPGTSTISSNLYESFSIGYPCAQAAVWTKKIVTQKIPFSKNGHMIPVHGPAGFTCSAWADAKGHAYSGGCKNGKKLAFGWNWNVANPHDYFVQSGGKTQLTKASGSDAETVLRSVTPTSYELAVQNTSGIGFINRFVWTPPSALEVTSITKTTGADCTLEANAQKIACIGIIRPPTCLCTGSGATVTIDFSVKLKPVQHTKDGGRMITQGTVGSKLTLTHMTAVPFLIPGTPAEAAKQSGE